METENEEVKPQIATARKRARKVIEEMAVQNPPIRISSVCNHLKNGKGMCLDVIAFDFGKNTDGQVAETDEGSLIGYNDTRHVHRKRFTVAHEIGHLLLGHTSKHADHVIDVYEGIGKDPREIEANQFAAELLMPLAMLKEKIKDGARNVKQLADAFWVSEEAMLRKILDSGLLNKL